MSNYSLQKYKGTATRHTCPNCGDKRSFTCYVDESGMLLHPSVGRCNHESSCGYHYTPKEYFHDHPECRTDKGFSFDRQRSERKPGQTSPKASIGYIPPKYVERSQSVHSNFFRFISSLLDSYYGSKAKEVLKRLLEEYRLGATRDGAVIFWQIDRTNRVRTGKVMQYNPEDGHRIKGGEVSAVDWIHSILKRQRVLPEDWLGGIREECRYRLCPLSRLCLAGDRRQEPVERGKAPCAGRTNRASLSRCGRIFGVETACWEYDLLQGCRV